MREKIKRFFVVAVVIVMCFSITALAGSTGFVTRNFGEFSISCYISCSTKSGTAETKGAPHGYKNAANIIIKDKNGKSLGGNSVTTPYNMTASAVKSIEKSDVKSALSGHYVKDSDGNPAQPLYLQVNLTERP